MKVKELSIKNVGKIENTAIKFNKPLTVLLGDVKQGKTTILNCVKWLFRPAPSDIIRHGQDMARIELKLEGGIMSREWYVAKDGSTKARKLNAVIDNNILSVEDVKALINPFLLDQDFFNKMSVPEKARYLTDVMGVDTESVDNQISAQERYRKEVKKSIDSFGVIEVLEIEKPNIEAIEAERTDEKQRLTNVFAERKAEMDKKISEHATEYKKRVQLAISKDESVKNDAELFNAAQDGKEYTIKNQQRALNEAQSALKGWDISKFFDAYAAKGFIDQLPKPQAKKTFTPEPIPEFTPLNSEVEHPSKDTYNEINNRLTSANIDFARWEQNEKLKEKQSAKDAEKQRLKDCESKIKTLRAKKLKYLQTFSGKIEGLEFNETGGFTYNNTSAEMLSDSQKMELTMCISAMCISEIDLELVDRGESLGKGIMDLIDYAEAEKRNVLVSVVGDKIAENDNIGVYVVENGNANAE